MPGASISTAPWSSDQQPRRRTSGAAWRTRAAPLSRGQRASAFANTIESTCFLVTSCGLPFGSRNVRRRSLTNPKPAHNLRSLSPDPLLISSTSPRADTSVSLRAQTPKDLHAPFLRLFRAVFRNGRGLVLNPAEAVGAKHQFTRSHTRFRVPVQSTLALAKPHRKIGVADLKRSPQVARARCRVRAVALETVHECTASTRSGCVESTICNLPICFSKTHTRVSVRCSLSPSCANVEEPKRDTSR